MFSIIRLRLCIHGKNTTEFRYNQCIASGGTWGWCFLPVMLSSSTWLRWYLTSFSIANLHFFFSLKLLNIWNNTLWDYANILFVLKFSPNFFCILPWILPRVLLLNGDFLFSPLCIYLLIWIILQGKLITSYSFLFILSFLCVNINSWVFVFIFICFSTYILALQDAWLIFISLAPASGISISLGVVFVL